MSKIDFSKAPEGATHYIRRDAYTSWYALLLGKVFKYDRGDWDIRRHASSSLLGLLTPIPPQPIKWDGEGLPPVGCECEVRMSSGWYKCEIVGYHDGKVVFYSVETVALSLYSAKTAEHFRPLRTPEDEAYQAFSEVMRSSDGDFVEAIKRGDIPHIKWCPDLRWGGDE